jgi:hypothetical protein
MEVTVDDVVCCDCGGVVTLFAIPDAVWDGLGYAPGDFACLACVGKRLNPELKLSAENIHYWIRREIIRQHRKFGLSKSKPFRMATENLLLPHVLIVLVSDTVASVPRSVALSRGEELPDQNEVKKYRDVLRVEFRQ